MNVVKTPEEYSFVGNPILFEVETASPDLLIIGVHVDGFSFQLSVFPYLSAPGVYKASFDVSDFLKNKVVVAYDPDVVIGSPTKFVYEYSVDIASEETFYGYVIPGGLSKQFRKYMISKNTNAFDYRFLNPLEQFIFTTRTDHYVIPISRKELGCIFFLSPTTDVYTVTNNFNSDERLLINNAARIARMVNLKLLVEEWELASPAPVSEIIFRMNGANIFKYVIRDEVFENSYLIQFKNSFGVYEFLEITGKASRTPEFGEDASYSEIDTELNDFRKNSKRVTVNDVFEVETGYKSTDELYFIGDLLQKSAAYFIDGSNRQSCIVTSENYSHALKKTTPESIKLKIQLVDKEQYYTPMRNIDNTVYVLGTENDELIITENGELIGV